MSPDERELRRLFEELRRTEQAPPFERVWHGAARRAGRRTRRLVLAAACSAALLVAAAVTLRWQGPAAPPAAPNGRAVELAAELGAWSSPLDFLGAVPGEGLFAGQPVPAGEARELLQLMHTTDADFGETL